jgi:hypothetical protein
MYVGTPETRPNQQRSLFFSSSESQRNMTNEYMPRLSRMYVGMCACVRIHTNMHTHTHTYIHTYTHTYEPTYVHACMRHTYTCECRIVKHT